MPGVRTLSYISGQRRLSPQAILDLIKSKKALVLVVGTDAGSTLHFQSGAIWWELEAWRAVGFTRREALIAATEGAARVLRLNDIGRLEPGARANFVLYRGDVESGPFDFIRVLAVAKGGVLFVTDGQWLPSS